MDPVFEPLLAAETLPEPDPFAASESNPVTDTGRVSLIPPQIAERISIGPAAPWIIERPLETDAAKETGTNPVLLLDWQHHAELHESYNRFVHRLDTMGAVRKASQWSVDFDPATEHLTIHALSVCRGEHVANNAHPSHLRVLQREERLEALIIDGRHTVVVLLEDVRVGDVLDLSFTIHSRPRIFPDHFWQLTTVPEWTLRDFYLSVHFARNRGMRWRSNDPKLAPEINETENETNWLWRVSKLTGAEPEPNVPGWHFDCRWIQVSDFASWAEVAAGLTAAWQEELQNPELLRLAESIAATASKAEARVERAITFLQDEIRYLSVNTELGGQIPTPPGKIIKRGFGDCKDKSFAAAHILRLLGIPARTVLVHTVFRQSLQEFLPTPLFNHAILEYEIGGERRWVDATNSLQGGSALSRPITPFELGLPLGPGVDDLEPISGGTSEDSMELKESFYFDTTGRASRVRVLVTATGRDADRWRYCLAHDGEEAFARQRELMYQQILPGAQRMGKLQWRDDRERNELVLGEAYELRGFIRPSVHGQPTFFQLRAHAIQEVLAAPQSDKRRHPWALRFPCKIKHIIEIDSSGLPRNLARGRQIQSRAFQLFCDIQERPGFVAVTSSLQMLADHVPTVEFKAFKDKVREVWAVTTFVGQLPAGSIVPWKMQVAENLLPKRGARAEPPAAPRLSPGEAITTQVVLGEAAPPLTSHPVRERSVLTPRRDRSKRSAEPNASRESYIKRPNPRPAPSVPPPPPLPADGEHDTHASQSRRLRKSGRRRKRQFQKELLLFIGIIGGGALLVAMFYLLMHAK